MFKYVVNISSAEVQMIEGKVKVPFKGCVPVSLREADHDDIVDCIRRKWITLLEREPTPGELEKIVGGIEDPPRIEFESPKEKGLKELPVKKAEKAEKKEKAEKVDKTSVPPTAEPAAA